MSYFRVISGSLVTAYGATVQAGQRPSLTCGVAE